jgi:activating signal cointegrator complex subunit 2
MASRPDITLLPIAPFPEAAWRAHMAPEEWVACLDAWISLAEAHLYLTSSEFELVSARNESVATFLISYMAEMARLPDIAYLGDLSRAKSLRKACFFLSKRLLDTVPAPERLHAWDFLANFCKVYGKTYSTKLVAAVWAQSSKILESSLNALKSSLTRQLEMGIDGKPTELEQKLKKLNHLLYASPETATLFMSGSDFVDALVTCYKFTSPTLRKAIISTTYLCLIGLTDRSNPKFSLLIDQLFALSATAGASRKALTNADSSLVVGLVSATPILKQIMQRVEAGGTGLGRVKLAITTLENFRTTKRGGLSRLVKRINKGKGIVQGNGSDGESGETAASQVDVHRMSLISQIQDLFPDLGPGFVTELLGEYNDDTEQVISHLLEDALPPHLQQADRTEEL